MKREEDQELWDLLGRSHGPQLSPFFSRNVLRQIRQEAPLSDRIRTWLRPKVMIPASAIAVAVIAALLVFRNSSPPAAVTEEPPMASVQPASIPEPEASLSVPEQVTAEAEPGRAMAEGEAPLPDEPSYLASIDEQDYDVVSNLDDLLVLYESNLWDENSSL